MNEQNNQQPSVELKTKKERQWKLWAALLGLVALILVLQIRTMYIPTSYLLAGIAILGFYVYNNKEPEQFDAFRVQNKIYETELKFGNTIDISENNVNIMPFDNVFSLVEFIDDGITYIVRNVGNTIAGKLNMKMSGAFDWMRSNEFSLLYSKMVMQKDMSKANLEASGYDVSKMVSI